MTITDVKVTGIHDGDTIRVDWPVQDITFHWTIRFAGCNAYELSDPRGQAAKQLVEDRIKIGDNVRVCIPSWRDKYRRVLATVHYGLPPFVPNFPNDLNKELLAAGLAVPLGPYPPLIEGTRD